MWRERRQGGTALGVEKWLGREPAQLQHSTNSLLTRSASQLLLTGGKVGVRVGKKRRQGSGAGGGEMAGEGASAATADCELDQTDIPMTLPILPFMKLQSMSNKTIFHKSTMLLLLLSHFG